MSISGGSRALIGGCIFVYSGSTRLISFEINLISKEISRPEPEYMNMYSPQINTLDPSLVSIQTIVCVCATPCVREGNSQFILELII